MTRKLSFTKAKTFIVCFVIQFLMISYCYSQTDYTLQDNDVTLNSDGYINSCSYDFPVGGTNLTIPEVLNGMAVKGIVDRAYHTESILYGVFYDCEIWGLNLPASMEYVGEGAFTSNYIRTVSFGENSKLKFVGEGAFSNSHNDNIHVSLPASDIDGFEGWLNGEGNLDTSAPYEIDNYSIWYSAKIPADTLTCNNVTMDENGYIQLLLHIHSNAAT